jgi:hypothetical protein
MCHRVTVPPRRSPWITIRDPGRPFADRFEQIARARTINGAPAVQAADVIRQMWSDALTAAAALCTVEGHDPGANNCCRRCGATDSPDLIRMTPPAPDTTGATERQLIGTAAAATRWGRQIMDRHGVSTPDDITDPYERSRAARHLQAAAEARTALHQMRDQPGGDPDA